MEFEAGSPEWCLWLATHAWLGTEPYLNPDGLRMLPVCTAREQLAFAGKMLRGNVSLGLFSARRRRR